MFNTRGSINIDEFCVRHPIKQYLKLHRMALVAFVNRIDKKIWIVATKSILSCIEKNTALLSADMHSIKQMNIDKDDLDVIILEEHSSSRYLNHRKNYWYNSTKEEGYIPYENYIAFEYRFHEVINTDGIYLYIASKSRAINSMLLVGKFSTMVELEAYKAKGIEECLKSIDS